MLWLRCFACLLATLAQDDVSVDGERAAGLARYQPGEIDGGRTRSCLSRIRHAHDMRMKDIGALGMRCDVNCDLVIVGHTTRRRYFGGTGNRESLRIMPHGAGLEVKENLSSNSHYAGLCPCLSKLISQER
jgi:hypothetical protein